MVRKVDHQAFLRGLSILGFGVQDFQEALSGVRSMPEALRRVDALKQRIRKAYKAAALEHHPDRGGDVEVMKLLNSTMEIVELMEACQAPPPRPVVRVVRVQYSGWGPGSTTTTNSYTGAW